MFVERGEQNAAALPIPDWACKPDEVE